MNSCFHSEAITVDHHATCSFCQISSSLTNHELLTFSRHKFLLKYLDDISVKGFDILSIKADATCAYKNLIKIFAIIKQIVIRTFFLKKSLFLACFRNTVNWPPNLQMQLIPQQLLLPLEALLENSHKVTFQFSNSDVDAVRSLYRVATSGFVRFG